MGCDIHLYKEKKLAGKWVTDDKGWCDKYGQGIVDLPWETRFTDRDYMLFGLLADVRRETGVNQKPKGLPFNVCAEVKALVDRHGSDVYSHSFFYLSELKELQEYIKGITVTVSGMKDKRQIKKLKESLYSKNPDYDLLYPYCQFTSIDSYEYFEVEIPASVQLSGLKKIIDLFESDGECENKRIVFWFDR